MEGPVEDTLRTFGRCYLEILMQPERLALYRLVIGESGRLPKIGDTFFRTGPQVIWKSLVDFLRAATKRRQVAIDDPERAAHMFIDALRGHIHIQVLLNETRRPTAKEIRTHVDFVTDSLLRAWR